jgi:hypothetical protein
MNTILFQFSTERASHINVIDTVLSTHDCKSFAGLEFSENPMVTSASVIDNQGNEVLSLKKDKNTLKCTERISK